MQKRAVRLALLALLLVTGLGAAYITWDTLARINGGLGVEHEVDSRLDRMTAAIAALGAAQQAYVAPGRQRGESLTQASVRIQQLYDDIVALRRSARSSGAAAAILAFGQSVDSVVNLDDRAREHLRDGQDALAADLIYTEARQLNEGMTSQLGALKQAETGFQAAERQNLLLRAGAVVGGVAILWVVVVVALARPPRVTAATVVPDNPATAEPGVELPRPSVDLKLTAQVCTDLARVSSDKSLSPVLARAARMLDAPGLIVWLGAGEELFAATTHGYGPRTLARLGPIGRASDNATAAAWRTATIATVAGDETTNGAIVAPLFGPTGCFGVLSAEVRGGREHHEDTRAVMAIVAAQLSTIVAPWPAPSVVEGSASEEPEAQIGRTERLAAER